MLCKNDTFPSTLDPGDHSGYMGAESESGRTIPVSLYASRALFVCLKKNVNFTISYIGFPEELGHNLGRFGHLLSLYFARVSLVLPVDPIEWGKVLQKSI